MTSKPPFGMAASGHSDADLDLEDLSDQIDVDPSQDVTVEASEEATLEVAEDEHANTLTPPPLGVETPLPSLRAPTLMGLPLPSLPLPGVTAAAPPVTIDSSDDEVTVMARPSVADDEEEPTKIEPAETALHAAASKDDDEVTTALSAQASVERERALRKSVPPSLDLPLPAHGYGSDDSAEFEDPEDDGIKIGGETPGAISVDPVDDDGIGTGSYSAGAEEPSSELEAVLAPRRPTASLGSLGSLGALGSASPFSGSPVLGRPDTFGSPRLPTPSPGFGGLSLPSPAAPAPTNSPFSARLAPAGSPYAGRGTTSSVSLPALQIPAPSGVAATTTGTSGGLLRSAPMPIVGVVAVILAAAIFGFVAGAKWAGGRNLTTVAVQPAAPAPAPVVIQPVAPTPPPATVPAATAPAATATAAAAPTPAAARTAPAAAPAAVPAAPTTLPVAQETAAPVAKPVPRPAVKRVARAHKVAAADDLGMPKAAPAPKAAAPKAKPAPKAKAKAWVDPFAE